MVQYLSVRDELAARFFVAMMRKKGFTVTQEPSLGYNQIQVCFILADTFLGIANEGHKKPGT